MSNGGKTIYYGGGDLNSNSYTSTCGVILENKAQLIFDPLNTSKGIVFADGTTLSSAKGAVGPTGAAGSQGSAGTKGDTGPAGSQGPAGPAGSAGSAGSAGAKGDTGPAGPAGPAGSTSAKGDTGSVGPTGSAGAKGDTGLAGPTGAKGDTGLAGPTGAKGDTGLAGPTGSAGPAGSQGLAGSQGSTGAKGDTGPIGPAGSAKLSGNVVIDSPTTFDVSGVSLNFNTNSNYGSLIYFISPKTGSNDKPTVVFNCNVQFNGYIVSGASKCVGSSSTDTALNIIGDINTSGVMNSEVSWKT
jgi:hypothetical protein